MSKSARKRTTIDHILYPAMALLTAVIAFWGFSPSYFEPMACGEANKATSIHIHALIYVGWLALFLLQASLPMLGKTRLHVKIGPYAVAYAALVFIVGLGVTFSRLEDWLGSGDIQDLNPRFLLPLTDMIYFALLFGLAIYFRKQPELHKRLILLTGTMLVFPGAVRIEALVNPMNMPLLFLVWLAPIWIAILHDGFFRRKFYPVYALGLLLLATMPLRLALMDSSAAISITEYFSRLVTS